MALKERKIYPKWEATARGGRLYYNDEGKFSNHLIPYNGKRLQVIVKPYSKNRSRQEEKFYHAVVVRMVAEAMDISDQEAHEFLKSLFLTVEESKIVQRKTMDGMLKMETLRWERVMSTTELNDKAYREYWDKCIHWAALPTKPSGLGQDSGLEIFIPFPNEVDYKDY